MSHSFGDLLMQFRARIGYDQAILDRICAGKKDLTAPSGRDRVVRVIEVLHEEGVLTTFDEVIVMTFTAGQQQTIPIWMFAQLTRPVSDR